MKAYLYPLKNNVLALIWVISLAVIAALVILNYDLSSHSVSWVLGIGLLSIAVFAPRYSVYLFLVVPPGIFLYFQREFQIGLTPIVLISLAVLICLIIKNRHFIYQGKLAFTLYVLICITYLIGGLLNNTLKNNQVYGTVMLLFYYGLIYLLILNSSNKSSDIGKNSEILQLLTLCSVLITAAIGIFQAIPIFWGSSYPDLPGLLYNRNHFGYFACFGLAITMPRFLAYNENRSVWFILSAIALTAVLFSMSRGAWFSSILIITTSLIIFKKKVYWILPILFLYLLTYLPVFNERLLSAGSDDISTGRFRLWKNLWEIANKNLIAGKGVGFMWELTPFDISKSGGYSSELNPFIYAHNDFLFFLLEIGIVGPLLLLCVYLALGKFHVRKLTDKTLSLNEKVIVVSALLSLYPMLIAHLVDTAIFGSTIPTRFFALMATSYLLFMDRHSYIELRNNKI